MIELALLSVRLGLENTEICIATQLREVLLYNRDALKGSNIEKAYTLREGHPIRKVIVQALARIYLMSEKSSMPYQAPVYDDSEENAARRHAFGRDGLIFQHQIDTIEAFSNELSKEALDIFLCRTEGIKSAKAKSTLIKLTDPLTERCLWNFGTGMSDERWCSFASISPCAELFTSSSFIIFRQMFHNNHNFSIFDITGRLDTSIPIGCSALAFR